MNCTECGIELASPDLRKATCLGDCWPACSLCTSKAGGPGLVNRQELLHTLYAAGRRISSCAGCGVTGSELELHFLTPLSKGGGSGEANLLVLCPSCHDSVHQGAGIRVGARIVRNPQEGGP